MTYRGEAYPHMISIASTLMHRGSPASVSPPMSLISSVRITSASVSSSEESCLSKRKTTRVPRRANRSGAPGECFKDQGEDVVCNESKSSECCERDSHLRKIAGIQVPDGESRGETLLAEQLVVVRGYALDQLESRRHVGTRAVGIADTLRYSTDNRPRR